MLLRPLGLSFVGRQLIRIVAERRNRHAVLFAQRSDVVSLRLRESLNVDVRDTAILAIRTARRPAHHFDALVAFSPRKREDLFERQFPKNCADKSQLHSRQ